MSKERRWCLRKDMSLNVDIVCDNQPDILHCKTLNLGLEGIFIETNNTDIKEKKPVKVMFPQTDDTDPESQQILASVVHSNDQGIGLSFRIQDVSTIRFMRKLFYKQK